MVEGTEYCGYCNSDFNFKVKDDVWVVPCKECGRPTVLCDKCYTVNGNHDNCGCCPYVKEQKKLEKEWKKTQIGKILWYEDEDNPFELGWFKVVGFNRKGAFRLKSIEGTKTIVNFGESIDFRKKYKGKVK